MILSDKLRDQILAAHNYFRKLEGASDMKRVVRVGKFSFIPFAYIVK